MAVPKKKISQSKKNMRRSHHALRASHLVECANCGELKEPHRICDRCGHYGKDKNVIVSVVKKDPAPEQKAEKSTKSKKE